MSWDVKSLGGGGFGGISPGASAGIGGGNSAIYQGTSTADSGDFVVAYAAATQLTLSELQFQLVFENLIAIYEYDGDNLVKTYKVEDDAYDWTWAPAADKTTGTLTLTNAVFGATNTFVVVVLGPKQDLLDVLTDFSGNGTYQSPRDFTVAQASGTTLSFSGMEFDPDVDDIRAVVEVATGGKVRMVYTRREWAFTWAAGVTGAGTLTITGATLQATSSFIAFVEGPPRSYDVSTNSNLNTRINPERNYQDSSQKSASSLGNGTEHEYFDVELGRRFTVRILDSPGIAGDNTYTLWISQLNDGTAEGTADYQDRTLELVGQATVTSANITADPSKGVWQFSDFQAKRVRITQVRANDGGNTDGAYQYDAMWS
jgi:hypothetical protein